MIDPELLDILICPETHQELREADDDLVERVNRAIQEGRLQNRAGEKVEELVDGGLVREDGDVLYPIRDDIPVMLVDEALPIADLYT